ncbi:kinase-like domain-containing protein [Tribonema minus]|uniref:Casein kinase I n=1 Tax=Tribonema minus TaxID=303371 RepID=A0A835YU46_9STRA|nr:kinase-like domain-containing protein [Tribonema minus]
MLHTGEVIGGRYRVERKLERGTFTELYQAVDTRPPKASPDGRRANGDAAKQPPAPTRVALKVEVQGMQQSVLKASGWESYVLRELQSLPFVARYVGQHTHGDKEVLVMELLHGGDVRALRMRQNCPPGTPMPISACIDLAQEMLRCLEGLHGAGYLHRDVKPSNFVRRNRGDKQLCLVDFGLANKYMKSDGVMRDERPHAEFRGTTTYASPYAHDFKDQSRRDDLFALVYVFLDLARGELPWSAAVRAKNKDEVARLKKEYLNAPFMKTLPYNIAIGTMLRHLKALAWGDAPSYALLRRALEDMRAFAPHADEAPRLDFNWDPPAPPPRASTSTLTSTPAEHKSLAAKLEDVQREGLSELERCKRCMLEAAPQEQVRTQLETAAHAVLMLMLRQMLPSWPPLSSCFMNAHWQVPVEQLEQLLEVACKYNEFYITPGLSAKQMYKVQRQVYDVEQAVEAAKSRPPPVMSFTMA